MSRRTGILLWTSALTLLASSAFADIVLPSAVKMICASGPYTLMVFPALITLPLLLVVSLLEAAIARLFLRERKFSFLFFVLFGINFGTSAVGLLFEPEGNRLWTGIILAYLGTVLLEGMLVLLVMKSGQRQVGRALGISGAMNTASYGLIALLVACMLYLPAASCHDNLPISSLSGQLSLQTVNDCEVDKVELSGPSTARGASRYASPAIGQIFTVANKDGKRYVVDRKSGRAVGKVQPGYTFKGLWDVSTDGRFYANWVYGNARLGVKAGDLVVGDTRTGKTRVFPVPEGYLFEPNGCRLAITYCDHVVIYNPTTGRQLSFRAPCISRPRHTCWSPDGGYLAYLADMSPYNHDIGESYVDAVRVISSDGRRSVTVRRENHGCDWWSIVWTQ